MQKRPSRLQLAVAVPIVALLIYFGLSPSIAFPLYNFVLFPFPDRRTPNVAADIEELESSTHASKKNVAFRSANGRLVRGWLFRLRNSRTVFLVSHGKGNNIYGKLFLARALLNCGGSVLMYDYQGFGTSEGTMSIEGACEDAVAAYDYLTHVEHFRSRDVIAFGESFGCGVSGQLSERRKLGGVILQSGFTSLLRAGRDHLTWLQWYPDEAFPQQKMDNLAVFRKPHPPLLIVHGKRDKQLSFTYAEELYRESSPPKMLLALPEGGHCAYGSGKEFFTSVAALVKQSQSAL